jgi:Trypsin-co-occurring domain 1
MAETSPGRVLVQVVPVENGREISWGSNKVQNLADRLEDIKNAIASGAAAVADSLEALPRKSGWQVKEVSGAFGLSLAAEAGVILTRVSAETTFEVTVTFERKEHSSPSQG